MVIAGYRGTAVRVVFREAPNMPPNPGVYGRPISNRHLPAAARCVAAAPRFRRTRANVFSDPLSPSQYPRAKYHSKYSALTAGVRDRKSYVRLVTLGRECDRLNSTDALCDFPTISVRRLKARRLDDLSHPRGATGGTSNLPAYGFARRPTFARLYQIYAKFAGYSSIGRYIGCVGIPT